jgi:hypothetical protein
MHMKKVMKYVGMNRIILQIKLNTIHRKYKESAHMCLIDHPICQPSLDISPIWIRIIAKWEN